VRSPFVCLPSSRSLTGRPSHAGAPPSVDPCGAADIVGWAEVKQASFLSLTSLFSQDASSDRTQNNVDGVEINHFIVREPSIMSDPDTAAKVRFFSLASWPSHKPDPRIFEAGRGTEITVGNLDAQRESDRRAGQKTVSAAVPPTSLQVTEGGSTPGRRLHVVCSGRANLVREFLPWTLCCFQPCARCPFRIRKGRVEPNANFFSGPNDKRRVLVGGPPPPGIREGNYGWGSHGSTWLEQKLSNDFYSATACQFDRS